MKGKDVGIALQSRPTDGIPVVSEDSIEKIRNRLAGAPPGTPFKMSVLRAGRIIELTSTAQ